MQVLSKLISLLFHFLPGSYWGMCSTKTWEMKQGIKQREKSNVWEENGQYLTSSDMASINWSLAMSWVMLPRRSWISPVWCRTFSWYILKRKELKHGPTGLWCCSCHSQLLLLSVSPQRISITFSHSPGISIRFLSLKYYSYSSSYLEYFKIQLTPSKYSWVFICN